MRHYTSMDRLSSQKLHQWVIAIDSLWLFSRHKTIIVVVGIHLDWCAIGNLLHGLIMLGLLSNLFVRSRLNYLLFFEGSWVHLLQYLLLDVFHVVESRLLRRSVLKAQVLNFYASHARS